MFVKPAKTVVTEEKKPQIIRLLSGVMIAYAITCIAFIGYAILLTYSSVTEQNISLVVTVVSIISVIVAGFDAAKGAENRGWMWGIGAGILYAVILLMIGAWVNRGFLSDTRSLTLMIICIAGGGFGGVLGINLKK